MQLWSVTASKLELCVPREAAFVFSGDMIKTNQKNISKSKMKKKVSEKNSLAKCPAKTAPT
jgi:hypothetical protein